VIWSQTPALDTAAGTDRVYTLRTEEDGGGSLTLGDGTHGARPATGVENITATYRVGIGADGAVDAGRLSLLTRRPLGIRSVTNPEAARAWAPPEGPADARRNAPQRARTLDRAVSVADHEDFAAGFAGVAKARADAVWNGESTTVVISVIAATGDDPSPGLLADLRSALDAARDPATALEVLKGEILRFGLAVELRHDPAYDRAAVEAAVHAALTEAYAPAARGFTEPVTPAGALLTIRRTPGVIACTMPRLALASGPGADTPVLTAAPARWLLGESAPSAAQLLAVASDQITIGAMP
jgi:predicted phage baseplate assembly protein